MIVEDIGDQVRRVKTGVSGFDDLVEGGFPEGFNILVMGLPGTGKTLLGQEFLYRGALAGEPGVYISLDMSDAIFRQQGDEFGWEIERLEKEDKLSIIKVPLDRKSIKLFDIIGEEVNRIGAKRLVFDSLASFSINIDQFEVPLVYDSEVMKVLDSSNMGDKELFYTGNSKQRMTYLAINHLTKMKTTNVIITDQISEGSNSSIDGVSEYVCDGVVCMYNELIGVKHARTMSVLKMRDTNHSPYVHNFDFNNGGISVKPAETI